MNTTLYFFLHFTFYFCTLARKSETSSTSVRALLLPLSVFDLSWELCHLPYHFFLLLTTIYNTVIKLFAELSRAFLLQPHTFGVHLGLGQIFTRCSTIIFHFSISSAVFCHSLQNFLKGSKQFGLWTWKKSLVRQVLNFHEFSAQRRNKCVKISGIGFTSFQTGLWVNKQTLLFCCK